MEETAKKKQSNKSIAKVGGGVIAHHSAVKRWHESGWRKGYDLSESWLESSEEEEEEGGLKKIQRAGGK